MRNHEVAPAGRGRYWGQGGGSRRGARAASASVLLCGAGWAAAGCSPCDGVVRCESGPRVGVSGQFVNRDVPGAPAVPGVRVEVVRTGGVELEPGSASATSDGTGWWSVSVGAREAGEAVVDVVVTPPGPDAPYRVGGLRVTASVRRGNGDVLGRWVPRAYVTYVGALVDKATGGPVAGARVTIIRRGGARVAATTATDTTPVTNGSGYFLYDVRPLDFAPVLVDFVVERAGYPVTVIRNVAVAPGYEWVPPRTTASSTFVLDGAGGAAALGARSPSR